MAIPDYKLSSVLNGHSMDVRCVATTKEFCLLSASRDRTAKLWHPEGVKDFVNVVTYKGHKNFVSCVCWLPPCAAFPEGLVITGSNDNTIHGYTLQDGAVLVKLTGHENVVCSVVPGNDSGTLISSSWDSTARVWNLNAPQMAPIVLKGHQATVWAAIELANGAYATASADKSINLWRKQGGLIIKLSGHTDCVRGLAVASAETFLSCANDASVRLWTNKGECLNTYYGHTNYIYSISINPSLPQGFVTSGEDGAVKVWSAGDCVRELRLPVESVWSVTCLENGDIVTGASDGLVRVFTRDPLKYADEATLKSFEEEVQKVMASSQQEIGGFKLSELPGPEALLEPGKSEGKTKLIRRGTNVKCYSWSVAQNTWNEIGDVLGANPPSEGKTMYQGKEYDFVFSVDIKDGAPALKLPFNKNEDPWVVAQAFIHNNDLSQGYLDEVANFIVKNAKLDALPDSSNGFADPFTGEGRYVPGTTAVAGLPPPSAADPFTGSGAYTTAAAAAAYEKLLVPHDSYIRIKDFFYFADNLPANQMLTMRVLVNAFSDLPGEMLVLAARESVVHAIISLTQLNNNTQIAAASLLLNLSVALAQQTDNSELVEGIVDLLTKITDNEAYFRGLVALGTLLAESPNKLVIQTKIVTNVKLHNRLKSDSSEVNPSFKKICVCSQQILQML
ncbi:jg7520 [Pararge aegeria aegeria]|uniref:Jg7520 protein n=1 Tax=Pararge aegeria aegeria TaxID=348720 RepID=A0A8S4RG72_9NEOP|nr:jg7520 [Pararge aegeria aegeria]